MRISCRKGDIGYVEDCFRYKVLLGGVQLTECITADDELGEALCYVRKDGLYIIDKVKQEAKTIIKRGDIKIVKCPSKC